MKLLDFKDYKLIVNEEAYLVKPIRELYKKDKTKDKEYFFSEMSYLFFMVDPRSNYSYLSNLKERAAAIIEQEGLPKTFKPSKELEEAMEIYKKLTFTASQIALENAKIGLEKIGTFLRNIDLEKKDKFNKPIYTISTIASTIKQIPQLARDIAKAEKDIDKDIDEATRARGGMANKSISDNGLQNLMK